MAAVNNVLSIFEGNINPGDQTGIKIYLQETEEIDKDTDKIDVSVSNSKYIINPFLNVSNKYIWGRISFMVNTGTCAQKNIQGIRADSDLIYTKSITWIFWTAKNWGCK